MATPRAFPRSTPKNSVPRHLQSGPEIVDPRWILSALAAVFALALVCAYVSLCVIYRHNQWQLVLHPSRSVPATPNQLGLAFQPVRFADDAAGQPQLTGWWLPANNPDDPAVLLLHAGDGSMADTLPLLRTLHNARMAVFVFDYRGFGASAGRHPEETAMEADSASALAWLKETKHLPASEIVPYGIGVGASLAVRLAAAHRDLPAVILASPQGDFLERAIRDSRSRFVPVRWLFKQDFPLADPLHTLHTPKLLITDTAGPAPLEFQRAADPKMTVEYADPNSPALLESLRRFFGNYVVHAPAELKPRS